MCIEAACALLRTPTSAYEGTPETLGSDTPDADARRYSKHEELSDQRALLARRRHRREMNAPFDSAVTQSL